MPKRPQKFGGTWTDRKLAVVRLYLPAYATALKNKPFRLVYVDAFAGSGYRTDADSETIEPLLFDEPGKAELAKGSPVIALESDPPFDSYVFIEKSRKALGSLKGVLDREYPARQARITYKLGDANSEVVRLCRTTVWQNTRAVMFLDPFGMQVEWPTIKAIAETRAIDLFYLFPTGMGLNRLLTRSGEINPAWQTRLDKICGTTAWRNFFYEENREPTLFEQGGRKFRKIYDEQRAQAFILDRMKKLFAWVPEPAFPIRSKRGSSMYLLIFACGNEAAARVARPIVEHIFRKHAR